MTKQKISVEIRYIVGLGEDKGTWVDGEEEIIDEGLFTILVILKEGGKLVGGRGSNQTYVLYDWTEKYIKDISKSDMDFLRTYLIRSVYEYATKVLHSMVYLYKVWI